MEDGGEGGAQLQEVRRSVILCVSRKIKTRLMGMERVSERDLVESNSRPVGFSRLERNQFHFRLDSDNAEQVWPVTARKPSNSA